MRDEPTAIERGPWLAAVSSVLPIALVAAVIVVHLLIAGGSVGPMYLFDEVGYLAGAESIARGETVWSLCGDSYSAGWSLALGPLWALPVSPIVVYQLAVFASAAVGAAVIWPATLLARRLGATPLAALAIGALVTLVPARALLDNYVLAENPLTFMVVLSVVLALRLRDRAGIAEHVAFGLALGVSALIHTRAVPFVAVGVAWLVCRAVARRSGVAAAALGVAPALALAGAGYLSQQALGSAVFGSQVTVSQVLGTRDLGDVLTVIVGQGFTQAVSWWLLPTLGLVMVAARVRDAVRTARWRAVASPWAWVAAGFAAQAAFTVYLLSGFESLDTRLDVAVYGRYLDPFIVPLAVVGAVALWNGARARAARIAAVATIAATAAYAALILPWLSPDAAWIPFATPGLLPYLDVHQGDDRPALLVAVAVTAAGIALLYAARSRRVLWLATILGVAVTATAVTDAVRVDPFEADVRTASTITKQLAELDATPDTTTLTATILPCAERNKLQFELASTARLIQPGDALGSDYAVGPAEWPEAVQQGYARMLFTVWEETAIWVPSGP